MARAHASQASAPDWDQDSICCEAVHANEDIYYAGSEDEHYDSTFARRLRYKAAAQRFLDGDVPLILSAALQGPFDVSSEWKNPWQPRPAPPMSGANGSISCEKTTETTGVCQLPSPSSVVSALPDAHPYMTENELGIVSRWRENIHPTTPAKHQFWCPDSDAPSSSKKRRAKDSGWLKKGGNKRRRTRNVETCVANTPSLHRSSTAPSDYQRRNYLQPSMTKTSSQKARDRLQKAILEDGPDELSYDSSRRSSPIHKRSYHAPVLGADGYGSGDELSQEKVEADLKAAATLSSPVSQKGQVPRMLGLLESSPLKIQLPMQEDEDEDEEDEDQVEVIEDEYCETKQEVEPERDNDASSELSSVSSAICGEVQIGGEGFLRPHATTEISTDAIQDADSDSGWSGLSTPDESMLDVPQETHELHVQEAHNEDLQLLPRDTGTDMTMTPSEGRTEVPPTEEESYTSANLEEDGIIESAEVDGLRVGNDAQVHNSADAARSSIAALTKHTTLLRPSMDDNVEELDGYDSDHVLCRLRNSTVNTFRLPRRQRATSVPLYAPRFSEPSKPPSRGKFQRTRQKKPWELSSPSEDSSGEVCAATQEPTHNALSMAAPCSSGFEVTSPDCNDSLQLTGHQSDNAEGRDRPSSPLSSLDFEFAEIGDEIEQRLRGISEASLTSTPGSSDSLDSLSETESQMEASPVQGVEMPEADRFSQSLALEPTIIPASQRSSWSHSQGTQVHGSFKQTTLSQVSEDLIPSTPVSETQVSTTTDPENPGTLPGPNDVAVLPTPTKPSTPKAQIDVKPLSYYIGSSPEIYRERAPVNVGHGYVPKTSILRSRTRQHSGKHVTWAPKLVQSEDNATLSEFEKSRWEKEDGYERARAASPPPKATQNLPTEQNDNFHTHFQTITKRAQGGEQHLSHDSLRADRSPMLVINDVCSAVDGEQAKLDSDCGNVAGALRAKSPDLSQPDMQDLMDMTNDVFNDIEEMMQEWDIDAELEAERRKVEGRGVEDDIGFRGSWML